MSDGIYRRVYRSDDTRASGMKDTLAEIIDEIETTRKAEVETLRRLLSGENVPVVRDRILHEVEEIRQKVRMSFQY